MVNRIITDYSIPRKHHSEFKKLYSDASKAARLVVLGFSMDAFKSVGKLVTEQSRLEKQIYAIWGDKPITGDDMDGIDVTITVKGQSIKTKALPVVKVVWEQLVRAQKTTTEPQTRPREITHMLTVCYLPLVYFFQKHNIALYRGKQSLNAVAKIIRDILAEDYRLTIEEQAIHRTLRNIINPHA